MQSDCLHRHIIRAHIGNLSPEDHRFLQQVIALFTDPQKEDGLAEFKAGRVLMEYEPYSGQMSLCGKVGQFLTN